MGCTFKGGSSCKRVGVADLSLRIEVDGRVYREAKQLETEIAA